MSPPSAQTNLPNSEQPPTQRRPIFRLTNWQVILIMLVVIGGRLVIDFSQRIVEGQQKLAEQRALEAQIAGLQAEQKSLQALRIYYNSQAYVEAWAHDQGKMVLDGEVLVIPVYLRESPDIEITRLFATTDSTVQTPRPAWQVWWSMFFDTPPSPLSQH